MLLSVVAAVEQFADVAVHEQHGSCVQRPSTPSVLGIDGHVQVFGPAPSVRRARPAGAGCLPESRCNGESNAAAEEADWAVPMRRIGAVMGWTDASTLLLVGRLWLL